MRCPAGCGHTCKRKEISDHDSVCLFKDIPCSNGCGVSVRRGEIGAHLRVCPDAVTTCDDCGSEIKRSERELHGSVCPRKVVRCRGFYLGCPLMSLRSEVSEHEHHCESARFAPILEREKQKWEEEMRRQMTSLSEGMERRVEGLLKGWDVEKRQLSDKVFLHFRNITFTRAVENESIFTFGLQVDQLSRDVNRLTPHIGSGRFSFNTLRSRPNVPSVQKVQCGAHAIKVEVAFLSRYSTFSIRVMFCSGPFDDVSPLFPFQGSLRIILKHPRDASLNVEAELDTDEDEDFAELSRSLVSNPDVHGWDEFVTLDEARSLVRDDGQIPFDLVVKWKNDTFDYGSRKRKREREV